MAPKIGVPVHNKTKNPMTQKTWKIDRWAILNRKKEEEKWRRAMTKSKIEKKMKTEKKN